MDAYNPYTPPRMSDGGPDPIGQAPEGSYVLGFLAGLVFALIGLIAVHVFGKPETKRGSLHGFLVRIGLAVFVVIVLVLFA